MLTKKAFTIVELMLVILVTAILAAVVIPIMRARVDAAKWTEGRSMAGTIASSIRVYGAEHGPGPLGSPSPYGVNKPLLSELGLTAIDLQGSYFNDTLYSWVTTYDTINNVLTFTIIINRPPEVSTPEWWTLTELGTWSNSDIAELAGP